jgi:hypothetical protein
VLNHLKRKNGGKSLPTKLVHPLCRAFLFSALKMTRYRPTVTCFGDIDRSALDKLDGSELAFVSRPNLALAIRVG